MQRCMQCKQTEPAKGPDGRIDFTKRLCVHNPPQVLVVNTTQGLVVNNAYPTVDKNSISCRQYTDTGQQTLDPVVPIHGEMNE